MVFVTNEAGLCTFLSKDWTSLTGQSLADARSFGWTRVVHPEDRESVRNLVLAAIKEQCAFSVRYRVRAPDQRLLWVLAGAVPSFGPPGRTFLGFHGSVTVLPEPPEDIAAVSGCLRPTEPGVRQGSTLERAADHLLAAHSLVSAAASESTLVAVELALRRLGEDLAGEALTEGIAAAGLQ
ncbi:PAS domain-containing protein [Methylobacterium aerolatum]|uniref:histidine kinase n=1 Tax=Methylobacterium aerolatum TaxID=418708 RepID=A0ABU0I5A5_9HYPH|nr:PAS domain-containing protein [Methylobacterium aerolatum]MDQ0449050.1 PAS domain-containing protein [Methylobacterium aerolatum]GJD35238.1 hypothetical protein FMGBMHLM_2147 [Methylobacterium aerolatum]